MPDKSESEHAVSNKSHDTNIDLNDTNTSEAKRRTSSTRSLRSQHRYSAPSSGSRTPLTPDESPPFLTPRKRGVSVVEHEDKTIDSVDSTPVHTRDNSGSSGGYSFQVCICQPDPKIPRPRNAFILYRQHHQAKVAAKNPGLANPDISKVIGEQWQKEAEEEKTRWKGLAEEEKLRHQHQYPDYRYQPKRHARRNSISDSGEKTTKCKKCGGRTVLTPTAPNSASYKVPVLTPGSAVTPVTRTLPNFQTLTLQTPATERTGSMYRTGNMSPSYRDEKDDLGPLSPDSKRRRYNGEHVPQFHRVMPARYGPAPPGSAVGPGTPFPFVQGLPLHPFPPTVVHGTRESLPGLRGLVGSQIQTAGPKPGMGYQQHRLSQGHPLHDRSLTLPPLNTGNSNGTFAAPESGMTPDEKIMNISFRYKIKVLSQVAPPADKGTPRGPLIAVEGDSAEAAQELAERLRETLSKSDDLDVKLLAGPDVSSEIGKEEAMARYHNLAAEWLAKSKGMLESISMKPSIETGDDVLMTSTRHQTTSQPSERKIEEIYNDSDGASSNSGDKTRNDANIISRKESCDTTAVEKMDIDKGSTSQHDSTALSSSIATQTNGKGSSIKPVAIIPNYSLHTSNLFARLIRIGPNDPYAPNDHWQWTATLWRGIVGPDLTVYVHDVPIGTGPSVDIERVDGKADCGLFVVKTSRVEGEDVKVHVEASSARRAGFEVSEWVHGFNGKV